jgi:hypothetical protein
MFKSRWQNYRCSGNRTCKTASSGFITACFDPVFLQTTPQNVFRLFHRFYAV